MLTNKLDFTWPLKRKACVEPRFNLLCPVPPIPRSTSVLSSSAWVVSLPAVPEVRESSSSFLVWTSGRRLTCGPRHMTCHLRRFLLPLVMTAPTGQILTKDSVTVFVTAIMYYKVKDATRAVSNVNDYSSSAQLLAATTLRNVLGTRSTLGYRRRSRIERNQRWHAPSSTSRDLKGVLLDREAIAREIQVEWYQYKYKHLKRQLLLWKLMPK